MKVENLPVIREKSQHWSATLKPSGWQKSLGSANEAVGEKRGAALWGAIW